MKSDERRASVVCRVGARLCALPLAQVVETMRPLATSPVAGAPGFVSGVAIIRGAPVPVIDADALLGSGGGRAGQGRLVTVQVGPRQVALAVDEVLGVRELLAASLAELPSLLSDARAGGVASLGALDDQLLLFLDGARLVPESVWAAVDAAAAAAGDPTGVPPDAPESSIRQDARWRDPTGVPPDAPESSIRQDARWRDAR